MSDPGPHPFFLAGSGGRLFCVLYAHPRATWSALYLPPFGEEMNRSRRMAALLGRRVALAGGALLVLDPLGTGDSDGGLEGASWPQWLDDAGRALAWLAREGPAPAVAAVGLRTGALLALDRARAHELPHAVLWQPVARGDLFLSQLLRVRVAAGLESGGRETVKELRERLKAGEVVDVGGYPVTPVMADALDGLLLRDLAEGYGGAVHWLQVSATPDGPVPPALGAVVAHWMRRRRDVTLEQVAGEPFWSIEETTLAPALLDATLGTLVRRERAA